MSPVEGGGRKLLVATIGLATLTYGCNGDGAGHAVGNAMDYPYDSAEADAGDGGIAVPEVATDVSPDGGDGATRDATADSDADAPEARSPDGTSGG